LTFAGLVDRGMLPNVFPGAGDKPDYNTVDAALWFFEAWRSYVDVSGDHGSLTEVLPILAQIIEWHLKGTRYSIRADPADGLLGAGEPGVQLTWMDAKVGDWVVTPRVGKPVEVNALWYNALCIMAEFAVMLGHPAAVYRELAERVRASFARFADERTGGLYDVIDGPSGIDGSIRPNQILAVSLPHSPLSRQLQLGIVTLCGRKLLTSYGLRSLSPEHSDYKPRYAGDPWHRDGAYHQGTVWAWLLGHYVVAEYRVRGDADLAMQRLAVVRDHLFDAGLGTISEIFDADAPHLPGGAPSQAWSVACILEAWWRLQRSKQGAANSDLAGGRER
jgi:predicted glycogen debranching enzyme